ncbi:phage terminase large subunit [bacterium]|nr:phage terminase large subunit [bacterium]
MTERHRVFQALLRENFAAFAMKVAQFLEPGGAFMPNWHHDILSHRLDQVRTREIKRLIINAPPRSAKTIFASVALVAFIHGHDPTAKIACLSYSGELSAKLTRLYRSVIQSDWYKALFPNTRIAAKNTESEIELTAGGYRLAWSLTGTITGRGADLIIIDDPIKAEDAFSEIIRPGVNETFDGTILSRLDNKAEGAIIVVMQRFHLEDLSGYLRAKGGWTLLSLSAIAMEDEVHLLAGGLVHKRAKGEVLHPEREPYEVLMEMKAAVGELRFSAQYQQEPVPLEGNIIKWAWFMTDEVPPDRSKGRIIQSWDTAGEVGAANAYSACMTFLREGNHHHLLDVVREKLDYPRLKRFVIEHARRWGAKDVLIEKAALGAALIHDLRADPKAPQPIAIRPENDKITRMAAAAALIESRSVFLPKDAPWLAAFRLELLQFPHGAYMDQVDALSQYLNWTKARTPRFYSGACGEYFEFDQYGNRIN